MATIFTKRKRNKIVITLGVLGTVVAFSGSIYIVEYLVMLGVSIPPVAAIKACASQPAGQ